MRNRFSGAMSWLFAFVRRQLQKNKANDGVLYNTLNAHLPSDKSEVQIRTDLLTTLAVAGAEKPVQIRRKYFIVQENTILQLVRSVQRYLDKGWVAEGGFIFVPSKQRKQVIYMDGAEDAHAYIERQGLYAQTVVIKVRQVSNKINVSEQLARTVSRLNLGTALPKVDGLAERAKATGRRLIFEKSFGVYVDEYEHSVERHQTDLIVRNSVETV